MRMRSSWLIAPVLVLSTEVSFAQTHPFHGLPSGSPRTSYTIVDLSTGSPFPDAFAYGISPDGKITGGGTDPATGQWHAFVYNAGAFQDLGMLGYPSGANGVSINDSGELAAIGYGPGFHAVKYSNGHVTELSSANSAGYSINSLGNIVGRVQGDEGGWSGFTYIGGQFTYLGVDRACCINEANDYVGSVGYSWVYGGYLHSVEHAFINVGGVQTELGSIGGGDRTYTEAFGVNNSDEVTGYSTAADGTQHAFLYSGGVLNDLGTIAPYYTCGISINDSHVIVGSISTFVGGPVGSFVWSNGVMRDLLDVLGPEGAAWSQMNALQINNDGWIVGYGVFNNATHGFLVRPR
jgi:probable HAF family extracellular repeat protein